MTKKEWKRLLTRQTKQLDTYQKAFEPIIDTLADILDKRDAAMQEFEENGSELVTEFVSDRGASNLKKNPRLQVWQDLNSQALTYWRDLGLTPAGYKKLNDMVTNIKGEASALEKALNGISKELGKGT